MTNISISLSDSNAVCSTARTVALLAPARSPVVSTVATATTRPPPVAARPGSATTPSPSGATGKRLATVRDVGAKGGSGGEAASPSDGLGVVELVVAKEHRDDCGSTRRTTRLLQGFLRLPQQGRALEIRVVLHRQVAMNGQCHLDHLFTSIVNDWTGGVFLFSGFLQLTAKPTFD